MSKDLLDRTPKTEPEFNKRLADRLGRIFSYVRAEEQLEMPNSVTFRVDILARSANNRLLVFETKLLPPGRALPYSTSLSAASLKESLTHFMPELPPVVVLVTNGHVEDSVREVFAKAGIPVVVTSDNLDVFESHLRDALLEFAIDLPEFSQGPNRIDAPESTNQFCFVAFPKELRNVYSIAIEPAVHRAGLMPVSHKEALDPNSLFEWLSLAQVIIADLTGLNPNVLVEVGAAAGARKPTILLTQNAEGVPFNLRDSRILHYLNTPDGLSILSTRLAEMLVVVHRQASETDKGIRISDLLRNLGTIRPNKLGEPDAQDSVFFKVVLYLLRTTSGRNYLSLMEQFYETLDTAVPVLIRSKTFDDFVESATGSKPEIKDLPRRAPQDLGPYYGYTTALAGPYVGGSEGNVMVYATYLKDRRLVINQTGYHILNLVHDSLRKFIESPE